MTRLGGLHFGWLSVLFTLAVGATTAFGNREQEIVSPHGGRPYLVVIADGDGGSKREPGIYAATEAGKWFPILGGDVMSGRLSQGILASLELTKRTQRHESLAVIGGKLTLLSVNSRGNDPDSLVVLGGDDAPFVGLMDESVLSIPDITSVENLHLWQGPVEDEGQLVLGSLKQLSLHGTGITFALYVKRAKADEKRIELVSSPVVIDYQFQDVNSLRVLGMSATGRNATVPSGVVSRLLAQSLAKPRRGDTPALRDWRKKIIAGLAKLDAGEVAEDLPYFDARRGERRMPALLTAPVAYLSNGQNLLVQVYDPLTGRDGIAITGPQVGRVTHKDYQYSGRLDIDAKTDSVRYYANQVIPQLALAYINGALHVIIGADRAAFVSLDQGSKDLPERITYWPITVQVDKERTDVYLLVSTTVKEESKTELVQLRQFAASWELVKRFDVDKKFHLADDLQHRAIVHNAHLLFDNRTPLQKSVDAYAQVVQETMPYLDLTKTVDIRNPVQSYRRPLEEKEINGFVRYRVFDPNGALVQQTGLFVNDSHGSEVETFRGELLQRVNQATAELLSKRVRLKKGDSAVPTGFVLAALDASFEHGDNGFKVVLSVNYEGPPNTIDDFRPRAQELFNVNVPFKQLSGVYLAQMEKKASDLVYLIFTFDRAPSGVRSQLPEGGVYVVPLRLKHEKDGQKSLFTFDKQKERWLSKTALTAPELERRMLRDDDDGRIYFVVNPEVGESSGQYRVSELLTGKEILPNTASERRRKLKPFQTKDDGDDSFGSKSASWEVWYPGKLKDRYQKLLPDIGEKSLGDKLEAAEKLFQNLQDVFDPMAMPSHPAQHQVFLVPEYLKPQLMQAMYYLWAYRDRSKHPWQGANNGLKFYAVDPTQASQDEAMKNFESLRSVSSPDRAVLVGDMAEILNVDRPASAGDDTDFHVTDSTTTPSADGIDKSQVLPHLLYLIATEGERIELARFRDTTKGRTPRFGTALIATPAEWEQAKVDAETEGKFGLFDHFKVNHAFNHAGWRVWPPNTSLASPRVKSAVGRPVSQFEKEVFPTFAATLNDAADVTKPVKHRILIVPPELKNSILNLSITRWVHGADPAKDASDKWSRRNPHLVLYQLDAQKAEDQDDILENLTALRSVPEGSRGVLVADLHDIGQIGRSSGVDERSFQLEELSIESDPDDDDNPDMKAEVVQHSPHALYLLATEGRRLQLKEFEEKAAEPLKTSMLLVGTAADWEAIQKDLNPEARAGLVERFTIEELPVPSQSSRTQLLRRILDRPDIQGLRYRFDATGIMTTESGGTPELTQDEARDAVMAYMVTRCETLARTQQGKEVITTFIQFMTTFANSLVQDDVVRRRRVIDKVFVERLFSKIFLMPLSLNTLPPEDPLRRFSSQHAVVELGQYGHFGAIDLKMRVLKTLLSQTVADPVKAIPSSIIMFGETRTGKTLLFRSITKMAGLRMYDYSKPNEPGAQAMIINVGKLQPDPENKKEKRKADDVEDEDNDDPPPSSDVETMTVSEAIRHLHQFLSLPNGYRGHILFDDVHAASAKVRTRFLTEMRALFEANGGMFRVKPFHGQTTEIPVRNLSLYMTVNPLDDFKIRGNYPADIYGSIIAGIAKGDKDVPIDKSFLERWSLLLNMSQFPLDAKAPKLRDSLRETARETFNNQNMLVLVSPQTVTMVSHQFKDDNANFISRATPPIIARASAAQGGHPLYLITPKSAALARFIGDGGLFTDREAKDNGDEIDHFIRNSVVAIPVGVRYDGQIELLKIMVDTFRTQLLEGVLRAVTSDLRFAGSPQAQRTLLTPLLHGTIAHLARHEFIPPAVLNLDPYDFGARIESQQGEFRKAMEKQPGFGMRYFPFLFGDELRTVGISDELTGKQRVSEREPTRAHVLSEYVDRLLPEMRGYLDGFLRIKGGRLPATSADWLKGLPANEPAEPTRAVAERIANLFMQFSDDLYRNELKELSQPEKYEHPNPYDAVRLFLLVIDKTIAKLPWGETTTFVTKGLERASRDMALGQLQGVQHYLFNSQFSLVRPMTHEMVLQMASSSFAYREWKDELRDRMAADFSRKCVDLLAQGK